MNRRAFSDDAASAALVEACGILTAAAAVLSRTTGKPCSRDMVRLAIAKSKRLEEARQEGRERLLDRAEANEAAAVFAGDLNASWRVLENLGAARGYGRRVLEPPAGMVITDEATHNAHDELLRRYERMANAKEIERAEAAALAARTIEAVSEVVTIADAKPALPEPAPVPPPRQSPPQLHLVSREQAELDGEMVGVYDRGPSSGPKTEERLRLEEYLLKKRVEPPFETAPPEFAKGSMQCPT
jgi:hypothetical protein